ncbi:luciferin 4-monooxygenase-like isoform X2 [Choristoneura fumiferana]|uniref:luciferin 4-monooxygenase-like isoform X2 n=1 Tax=Choristoneura fumiferana TaxID=7141 RepID=UPI003D159F8D
MQIKEKNNVVVDDDSYHLGDFFLDYMNQPTEDHIWQIDAGTGEIESKLSVKSRSIRLAKCLRNAGLGPGDVIVVSGWNHLDVHIPFYAAFMNGHPLAGVDPLYEFEEVKQLFDTIKPKLAFCEVERLKDFDRAAKEVGLSMKLVTFHGDDDYSYDQFIKDYDDQTPEEEFKAATFDTNKIYAWLISTSGTTGRPKVAAFKHQDCLKILRLNKVLWEKTPKPGLTLSSVHWISSYLVSLSSITANHIKLQTSSPITLDHAIDIINKYKSRMREDANVWNMFGQTECIGPVFLPAPHGPVGNVGKDLELVTTQIVDPDTGLVISEPNKTGELWTKGPRFAEYYNNPEATAQAFSADGWYKTGDLFYKDENGYHFFVDRMSGYFRYQNIYVMPMEIERLLRGHPGVLDVCVLGVPDPVDGKRAAAVIMRAPGSEVSEQEIKGLVADKLAYYKHLHGGVIFVNEFPKTVTGKIARAKVKDMVLNMLKIGEKTPVTNTGNVKKLINNFQQISVPVDSRHVPARAQLHASK